MENILECRREGNNQLKEKNKLGGEGDLDLSGDNEEREDVIAALTSFGFTPLEARMAIKKLDGAGKSTAEKVRLALKYLGK